MRYLSICSGIEAASAAWMPLGWTPVAFSEIEPFPCRALAHHHPNVPNWGDMTKYEEWPDAAIDLLCGGTPCQSFSVAGYDHVITLIGERFYDIRGEVLADDKWIPFTDQRAFNNAYLWGKPQP